MCGPSIKRDILIYPELKRGTEKEKLGWNYTVRHGKISTYWPTEDKTRQILWQSLLEVCTIALAHSCKKTFANTTPAGQPGQAVLA